MPRRALGFLATGQRRHEGNGNGLPKFYREIYRKKLGHFSELISEEESRPVLDSLPPSSHDGRHAYRAGEPLSPALTKPPSEPLVAIGS